MQLNRILSQLAPLSPQALQIADPLCEVLGIYILPEGAVPKDTSLLYLCTQRQFSAFAKPPSAGCFLLFAPETDPAKTQGSFPPELNLILLPEDLGPQPAYALLSELFLLDQRLAAGTKAMLTGLLENRGLQHLVEVGYEVLRNPIFVTDVSNHYVACVYDETTFEPEGAFARFIISDILYNYVDKEGQALIRRLNIDNILATAQEPYCVCHPRFGKEAMFMSVRVHNVFMGKIFTVAVEHPFTEADRYLFTTLAELVGQEFQKDSSIVANRFARDALCLIDLITSSYAAPEMMERSAAAFKFIPGSLCLLAVTAGAGDGLGQSAISVHCSQLRAHFPNMPTAALDGRIVTLLFSHAGDNQAACIRELESFAQQQHLQIGLSNPFQELSHARRAYEQALRAVLLGQRIFPDKHMVFFRNILFSELITGYQKNGKAADLILPEIHHLMEFDKKNGSDYVRTLVVYLKHMGKSQKICEELHIHKNTLIYRVGKLRDTFGLALEDGNEALNYLLSLQIIQLLHALNG